VDAVRAEVEEARSLGIVSDDLRWCDDAEASALAGATSVLGGLYSPHCASLHPARLVRGLAGAVERRGVTIYEGTAVGRMSRAGLGGAVNRLETPGGRVRAEVVVRATEGFTARLPQFQREVVPLYSLMVATEPLPDSVLERIGVRHGLTFTDGRHLIIYGQRTIDGRLAFGGRGAPYHFRSGIDDGFDRVPAVHAALRATLRELFPALGEVAISHSWGGPLGVHRDWYPSVIFDRATGVGSAGGYVGDGVSTTNLAGRTLADLITGRDTEETRLCWVGHRSPLWEPEPLRWLGVNAGLVAMQWADRTESRRGRPSRLAAVVDRLTGH
jgi:glycine/D-amino acid oxidase-like deaminating enzyme